MDDMAIINVIKFVALIIGIGGVIFGLDALFGARLISLINIFLSKTVDFDKMVIGNAKLRRYAGIVFFVVSVTMLLFARKL